MLQLENKSKEKIQVNRPNDKKKEKRKKRKKKKNYLKKKHIKQPTIITYLVKTILLDRVAPRPWSLNPISHHQKTNHGNRHHPPASFDNASHRTLRFQKIQNQNQRHQSE